MTVEHAPDAEEAITRELVRLTIGGPGTQRPELVMHTGGPISWPHTSGPIVRL